MIFGGPGPETIQDGSATIVPGPGGGVVQVGFGAHVVLHDICEVESGMLLQGGFGSQLTTPVDVATLNSLGVTVQGFDTVVVEDMADLSQCSACGCTVENGVRTCCSQQGVCDSPDGAGSIQCSCNGDLVGPSCATPAVQHFDLAAGACAPDDPGCVLDTDDACQLAATFTVQEVASICDDLPRAQADESLDPNDEYLKALVYFPDSGNCELPAQALPTFVFSPGVFQQYDRYPDLMSHLAANGIAAASVDGGQGSKEDTRADRLQCYSRLLTQYWEHAAMMDRTRFALGGHSTGGEAALIVSNRLNESTHPNDLGMYDLLAGVSLAAADNDGDAGGDLAGATVDDLPAWLGIQGSGDGDTDNDLIALYDRVDSEPRFPGPFMQKGAIWLFDVRHNSYGGKPPAGNPVATEQGMTIARAYIGGFLFWHLNDAGDRFRRYFSTTEVPPSVANPDFWSGGPPQVFPQYAEGTNIHDGLRITVDDFEDGELGTNTLGATVNSSMNLDVFVGDASGFNPPYSDWLNTKAARVTWSDADQFLVFSLTNEFRDLRDYSHLSLRLSKPMQSNADCEATDPSDTSVSVALDQGGLKLDSSSYARVPSPDFSPHIDGCQGTEFFSTVRIPLADFCALGVDITQVDNVQLHFDQAAAGAIVVDSIEFTKSSLDPESSFCPLCGNEDIDPGEACDGQDLGGATCVNQGYAGGTLACNSDCTLDTSGCQAPCSGEVGCDCAPVDLSSCPVGIAFDVDGCFADGPGSYTSVLVGQTSDLGLFCDDNSANSGQAVCLWSGGSEVCTECTGLPGEGFYGCTCAADSDCQSTGQTPSSGNVALACYGTAAQGFHSTAQSSGACMPAVDPNDPVAAPSAAREEFERTTWLCKQNCQALGAALNRDYQCVFNQLGTPAFDYATCIDADAGNGLQPGECEEQGLRFEPAGGTCVAECTPTDPLSTQGTQCASWGYPDTWRCANWVNPPRCVPSACRTLPDGVVIDDSECRQFMTNGGLG